MNKLFELFKVTSFDQNKVETAYFKTSTEALKHVETLPSFLWVRLERKDATVDAEGKLRICNSSEQVSLAT